MLISRGKLDTEACRKAGLTAHEIMFKLRSNNIYSIRNVKQAVLEQNGQLIVVMSGKKTQDTLWLRMEQFRFRLWIVLIRQRNGFWKD